jgi:hypothetical protein
LVKVKATKRRRWGSPATATVWSAHAGAVLLAELADQLGLPDELVATAGKSYGLANSLGRDLSLVMAGATLAVAAVFQLARRHIQRVVTGASTRRIYAAGQHMA